VKVKLIRNKLAHVPKEGVRVMQFVPGDPAHRMALAAKLHEEAAEVADEPKDVFEYADLIEVALQLAHFNGFSEEAVHAAMLAKRAEKGGFGYGYVMVRE
jgi:predicted house-cleaning noncanonical NTP pyrophosphatase (MazG superfamily)